MKNQIILKTVMISIVYLRNNLNCLFIFLLPFILARPVAMSPLVATYYTAVDIFGSWFFFFNKIWKVRYLFSISVTFVLKLVLQTETVILGILFSISIPSISSATQLVPGIWFAIPVSVVLKLDFLTKPLLRTFLLTYSIFFLYVFYQYCIVIC